MEIGMNLPVMVPGLDREALLGWMRAIDAGPFSSLSVGERIVFPNPEIVVTLAAAAALTERVRIMSNVIVLPMHSAVLMAKQLATIDVISGGRLTVGVGAGAREEDFNAVGAPFGKRRLGQTQNQVEIMRRVWSGEKIVKGAPRPVEPLPVQAGGPEILSASLSARSIQHAARWADGICGFSFGPSVREVDLAFSAARRAWKDEARDAAPRLVTNCWFALGADARGQIDAYLERYLAFMGPGVPAKLAPTVTTTSAQALRDVVRQLADVGTDELCLVPTTSDPEELERALEVIA
ncbi:MAG: LLM class flavin-dependent oxidoreductase [bacterium]|nr:LLM class flavin-dependent oxidoreductase [bacterium]